MDKTENKEGKPKKELRCDPEQLELLKKCSEKRDMSEWNKWREENPDEEIWLQGANLEGTHLERARLWNVHLEGAKLSDAHLKGVVLVDAHLERAVLEEAHLEGADLIDAHLEGAELVGAHLEEADLTDAHLEGADLWGAHLEKAELWLAHLEGAYLSAHLEGTHFTGSVVDGSTLFWNCSVDRKTDFRAVGLESCRMDEEIKYLLEYNRRRMNCEDWYKEHPGLAPFAKAFFSFSDYGNSTWRII